MDSINIADLKDELNTLIKRLESGVSVELMRDGQPFARITPVPPLLPRKAIDFDALRRLAQSLPHDPTSAGDFVRQMRDDSRY